MTGSLILLALWATVPALAAGAASLRERHEKRFPDCPVCKRQKGASDAQNGPSERPAAAL